MAQEISFRSDVTVELVKHSAGDADVLWAARVSTKGDQSAVDVNADSAASAGLINYLMRDRHGSPFEPGRLNVGGYRGKAGSWQILLSLGSHTDNLRSI